MKEKKLKLKLEDIKVESFVTSLDKNASKKMIGGTGDGTGYTFGPTYCGAYGCLSYGGSCACGGSDIGTCGINRC